MLQDNELYQEIADGMATYIKYKIPQFGIK